MVGGPAGAGLAGPADGLAGVAWVWRPNRRSGRRWRGRLAALFRAADVVAVPSHNESFGLVALEAQAAGTPVIAAAVGGLVVAVRDGVCGLLVARYDAETWAEAVAACCAPSGGLRARGRRHAARFSWGRSTACWPATGARRGYRARYQRRSQARMDGRRFSMRRGVRASRSIVRRSCGRSASRTQSSTPVEHTRGMPPVLVTLPGSEGRRPT